MDANNNRSRPQRVISLWEVIIMRQFTQEKEVTMGEKNDVKNKEDFNLFLFTYDMYLLN